jgi:hypothetical protein
MHKQSAEHNSCCPKAECAPGGRGPMASMLWLDVHYNNNTTNPLQHNPCMQNAFNQAPLHSCISHPQLPAREGAPGKESVHL